MGRLKGGRNNNHYKYILRCYGGPEEYYTSYPHIYTVHPTLTKSAITNIIFYPERSVNNTKYSIIKLAKPLPVFEKKTIISTMCEAVFLDVTELNGILSTKKPDNPNCDALQLILAVIESHLETKS